MSGINSLGPNFSNLPNVLLDYQQCLKDTKQQLTLEGKTLKRANVENSSWQHFYDQKASELKNLCDFFELHTQKIRSHLFKKYKENYSRELSDREINQYINGESQYISSYEMLLEIKELLNKYQSVVNAFTSRGYSLNNLTKLYTTNLENSPL